MTHSGDLVSKALTLLGEGRSKKSIAAELGVSRAAIRDWSRTDADDLLAQRFADGSHDRASCPLIATIPSSEYAYRLGQYLGDGSISTHPRDVYRLRISCCDAYPLTMNRCAAAIAAVMPKNKVGRVHNIGCTEVHAFSKHWSCLFPQHGPGMKHQRPIVLAGWQQSIVAAETKEFLSGLFHSDGCRCINRVKWSRSRNGTTKTYEYPRYFFSNRSMDILQICGDALDSIGDRVAIQQQELDLDRQEGVGRDSRRVHWSEDVASARYEDRVPGGGAAGHRGRDPRP